VRSRSKPILNWQKVVEQYEQAFNKGDAKAIAALYTPDAILLTMDGQLLSGMDAIQKSFEESFAKRPKGVKATIRPGRTVTVSRDVRIQEGTGEVTRPEGKATRTRYLNTFVRQGGQWRAASVAVIAQTETTKP
jgi:uncharacterized protein (TIGR02246 family)